MGWLLVNDVVVDETLATGIVTYSEWLNCRAHRHLFG